MKDEVIKIIAEEMTGDQINHIEPVIGGRNSRIFRLNNGKVNYALKFFREDTHNTRDRFDRELEALTLFIENVIHCVPKIINQDRVNNCILLEWIDGEPIYDFDLEDITALVDFVKVVHEISKSIKSNEVRLATEACLNGNEIVTQINRRLEILLPAGKKHPELLKFLNEEFIPAFKKITNWSRETYQKKNMDFGRDIISNQLTLSPVDIGFHNCLRTENQLFFLDFEFFGRDDPAKLVADSLQHPGSLIGKKHNDYFGTALNSIFKGDEQFQDRLKCLSPLFGLKWCMIMLNPFIQSYNNGFKSKKDIKNIQLKKAIDKTNQIRTELF